MSTATVRIEADVSAVSRAFGTMRTQYQSALQAMRTESRREAAARVALERATVVQQGQTQRAAIRAQTQLQRQASRDRARIVVEEIRVKAQAEAQAVRLKVQAERNATRAAEKGAMDRMRLARQMLRDKIAEERRAASESQRLYNQQLAAFERVERQRLNLVRSIGREMNRERERLAREAERAARSAARTHERRSAVGGRGISAVGGAAVQVGSNLHGQMSDARRQRAESEQVLYTALMEAGATGADARAMSRQAYRQAGASGIDPDQLLGGIAAAQTQFNVLGSARNRANMGPTERRASLQESLTAAMRRGTQGARLGANPGEFLRLAGMFESQHITGIDDLLTRTVSMAQSGAVEGGAVTREAMAPIIARVSAAGQRAAPAERQEAMRREYLQAFAEAQMLASRGTGARLGQNALRGMNQNLTGNVGADRLRTNLLNASQAANMRTPQGVALRARMQALMSETGEGGIFMADPSRRGQRLLRPEYQGNALRLAERFTAAGMSADEATNITAGGGFGNRQSLQENWRRTMNMMMSTDADNVTGAQAVRTLMDSNLSPAEQARLSEGNADSPMAQYIRDESARIDALTNNTGAMGRLSEAFERWAATHPVGAAVGQGAAGLGTTLLGATLAPRVASLGLRAASWVGGLFGLGGTAAAATGAAGGTAGTAAAGTAAGLGLAGGAAVLSGLAVLGATAPGVLTGRNMAGEELSTGERAGRAALGMTGAGGALLSIYDGLRAVMVSGIREGMQNATVTVDPHTAQQVNASQPAPNGGRG